MNPATLSIIVATFPPRQRGTAIGHLGRRLGARARDRPARRRHHHRADQLELDLLHQRPGRRARRSSPPTSSSTSRGTPRAEQRPDVPGLVTSAVGLFALIYGLIEANNYGWTSPRILVAFGIAAVALVGVRPARALPAAADARARALPQQGVLRRERRDAARRARDVRRLLLRLAVRPAGCSATRRSRPGASFLPWTVLIILLAPHGRAAVRPDRAAAARGRRDDRAHRVADPVLPHGRARDLLGSPARRCCSAASACRRDGPDDAAAMQSVRADKAGVGSAVLNSARQVGGSLGIAIMGAIVAASATPGVRSPVRRSSTGSTTRS